MIKLVLEIEEKEIKNYKKISASCVDVAIIETAINATDSEIKSSKLIKDRLGIEEKTQIVNNCRNEQNREIVNLLRSLLND